MINFLRKMTRNEKLNGGDLLHIVEFFIVGGMVVYGVYTNSKAVPGIKDALASTQTEVAVLKTEQTDMRNTLSDIKDTLGRIENVLMHGRQ